MINEQTSTAIPFNNNGYVYRVLTGDLPGGSVVKNTPANAGDTGDASLIPGSGRSCGRENGNPPPNILA